MLPRGQAEDHCPPGRADLPVPGDTLPGRQDARRLKIPTASLENRSEEHTSELQSLMRISYAVFCLKKKKRKQNNKTIYNKINKENYKQDKHTQMITQPKN